MINKSRNLRARKGAIAGGSALLVAALLAGCSAPNGDGSNAGGSFEQDLVNDGVLTVAMALQFEPMSYLDAENEPAGYDVDMFKLLADELGLELKIENLDFEGLVPGLQSNKFDVVSAGLYVTEEREKVIDFTREYLPFVTILAVPADATTPSTVDAYNKAGTVITALQGASEQKLAETTFPNATVKGFPQQDAALLEVATGRADGSVVNDFTLTKYLDANPGSLARADFPEPLTVGFGHLALREGQSALQKEINEFLCAAQEAGTLSELYTKHFGGEMPEMPGGC